MGARLPNLPSTIAECENFDKLAWGWQQWSFQLATALSNQDIGPMNNASPQTKDGNCVFELDLEYGKGNLRVRKKIEQINSYSCECLHEKGGIVVESIERGTNFQNDFLSCVLFSPSSSQNTTVEK